VFDCVHRLDSEPSQLTDVTASADTLAPVDLVAAR